MKHIIKAALKIGYRIIYDYFAWMIKFSNHPEETPLEVRYKKVQSLIVDVCDTLNVKTTVIGKENIPSVTSCFFANHLSTGEVLEYFGIFDRPFAFIGKKEVKKMPFVGRMFASSNGLFLDRSDLKQELRVMMKAEEMLKSGTCNVFIFPEGTRNKDPLKLLKEFHKGTFRSAMKAGVPIVPVVNYGGFRILSTKYDQKQYPTVIKFLKPIYPEEYQGLTTDEVSKKVQSLIQKELSFGLRQLDAEQMQKVKEPIYRYNRIY